MKQESYYLDVKITLKILTNSNITVNHQWKYF